MGAFTAVLNDLYIFAFKYNFGFSSGSQSRAEDEREVSESKRKPFTPLVPTQQRDARTITYEVNDAQADVGFALMPDTFLYALPTRTFDGVVMRLPYGASFRVINAQGKWLQVDHHNTVGWVYEDDVTRTKQKITPRFTYETYYDANHETTVLLRASIDDQFHAAQLDLPLQDIEYVVYKLTERGQAIAWPLVRPRIAGTWQRILKGVQGIHLGVHPKKGAIMEYINAENTGHVAFVESVYPDGSITISEVGFPEEGVFHERTLTKEEWVELRPIFIEVA